MTKTWEKLKKLMLLYENPLLYLLTRKKEDEEDDMEDTDR